MDRSFYTQLASNSIQEISPDTDISLRILRDPSLELLPLLDAAFEVRKKFTGKEVAIHIINNAQNGFCPEDCHYCAQAKTSRADIDEYPTKSDDEILEEARIAYESGAFRYCLVYAGRGPSHKRALHIAGLIRSIKEKYPLQVCVSAGLMDKYNIKVLKEAGLDRLNHNLNSSESFYPKICSTHTYQDRLNTLKAARDAQLEICSGMIAGMGETPKDIVEVAQTLLELKAPSIPINFLIPIEGNVLGAPQGLTPEYCLRILCLFRFINPKSEIRAAAGREGHLRSMEVMALYPANSIFMEGYLNTLGLDRSRVLRMIQDAGFTIKGALSLDDLIDKENQNSGFHIDGTQSFMKSLNDLRPVKQP
ncbi:biotin synthase BioB [PVC group bacterium]|nr:biotin synthase BioB [PVC group bacterium]